MTYQVQIAIKHAFDKLFEDGVPSSFLEDVRVGTYGSFFELGLYFTDDDTPAGKVTSEIRDGKLLRKYIWIYSGSKGEYYCTPSATFEHSFKGKQIYMASNKDKTKWRVDIIQNPEWKYDVEFWSKYFDDVFDSDWKQVGKYLYENKSRLDRPYNKNTFRTDSEGKWVILKSGELLNLESEETQLLNENVTLHNIPIQYLMLHMLPCTSPFVSRADIIQKLINRIGNKYTKSVLMMEDNGDLKRYTFTSCHMYNDNRELTISEIEKLVNNEDLWNGDSLKLLPAK